ncbi:Transcription factor [Penicillium chermesinum]|uniref:Transcription factor n=1 Tax=Penicillium chermesinum TaxID=63820 RepID=A0A9W9PL19_9EURO|nr:Transcription factor [Penicillium chermesinum]KAJ5247663.1 Transcription factor [Penicillium chermesinum]KAJ6151429.1 Transcription factor [Penicillium chermesinum]
MLNTKYQDGKTDLGFLQGNFLLSQLDFADGNTQKGSLSVAIGLRVIQSLQLNQGKKMDLAEGLEADARNRITWAYFMLDRAYNGSRNYSLCLSDNHFTLPFPSMRGQNENAMCGSLQKRSMSQGHEADQGILACLIQLYSLWGKATEWVFEPLATSCLPPWQSGSAIAILESEWMQFETQFADAHRYMNVDFKRRAREDPDSRPYLSTWLCVQFLFHSIQCLIHHPFVTMIKLRHMSENLSATFLQKSFESSLLHSRWIARFVKEMADGDIRLRDPFFGYLAAIAATIQLEHTGNRNPQIALLVNNEYRVLVEYITELASQWESMYALVTRINELASRRQNHGSLFYNQEGFSGALSSMPTPSNLPRMSPEDESLMWDILDITSSPVNRKPGVSDITVQGSPEASRTNRTFTRASSKHANREPTGNPILDSQTSQTINETSEWSFGNQGHHSHTFATSVPDIPDWMIFGDFMSEHL